MGTGLINDAAAEQSGRWTILRETGRAAALFDLERSMAFAVPTVRVLTVSAPTIVLGSSQSFTVVNEAAVANRGIDVVRRRSGGGAVWLDDDLLWVDVYVPAADRLWDDDIGRSTWWLGQAWADALAASGVECADVHRGAMRRNEWSSLVCFAGLGPGEVTREGRKVVGISQRRNRDGALLQCGVVRRWEPDRFLRCLGLIDAGNDMARAGHAGHGGHALDAVGGGIGAAADDALAWFLAHLR